MSDAFISYRRKPSTALAHLIQKELQRRYRLDVYLDTTRTDGATVQFPERLLGAIDTSKVFVCLLANTTLDSEWVCKEIDRAYQQKKPCIPVFQEGFVPNSADDPALSYLLSFDAVHVFEHQGLFVDESLEKIARIVKETVFPSRRRWLIIGTALVGLIATIALGIFLTANQIHDLIPVSSATQNTVEQTILAQNVASASKVLGTPVPTATSDVSATQTAQIQLSWTGVAVQQAIAMTQSILDGTVTEKALGATRTSDAELAILRATATANAWTSIPTSTLISPISTSTPTERVFSANTEVAENWSIGLRLTVNNCPTTARSGPGVTYSATTMCPTDSSMPLIIVDGPLLGPTCGNPSICNPNEQGYWWAVRATIGYGDRIFWIWQDRLVIYK